MERVQFFPFKQIEEKANAAFDLHQLQLQKLLPFAEIQHIGSTSIPGAITKGDLDIAILVTQAEFSQAENVLAQHYERNTGSTRTNQFSSFKDDRANPPLGLQLIVKESEFDIFCLFRDYLRQNPSLLEQYNELKRLHDNKMMDNYRERKAEFIERVLELARKSRT